MIGVDMADLDEDLIITCIDFQSPRNLSYGKFSHVLPGRTGVLKLTAFLCLLVVSMFSVS